MKLFFPKTAQMSKLKKQNITDLLVIQLELKPKSLTKPLQEVSKQLKDKFLKTIHSKTAMLHYESIDHDSLE